MSRPEVPLVLARCIVEDWVDVVADFDEAADVGPSVGVDPRDHVASRFALLARRRWVAARNDWGRPYGLTHREIGGLLAPVFEDRPAFLAAIVDVVPLGDEGSG